MELRTRILLLAGCSLLLPMAVLAGESAPGKEVTVYIQRSSLSAMTTEDSAKSKSIKAVQQKLYKCSATYLVCSTMDSDPEAKRECRETFRQCFGEVDSTNPEAIDKSASFDTNYEALLKGDARYSLMTVVQNCIAKFGICSYLSKEDAELKECDVLARNCIREIVH